MPTRVERRVADMPLPADQPNRRQRDELRAFMSEPWRLGWLAFQYAGEKRRLAPLPPDWVDLPDAELARLCSEAKPVGRSRRLIE